MWVKVDGGINMVNLVHCKEIYIGTDGSTNLYRVHLRLVDGDARVVSPAVSKQEALSIVDIIEHALTNRKLYVLNLDREIDERRIKEKKYGSAAGFAGLSTF